MSISNVYFNFWRKASMPILVISLVTCYFNFGDNVAVHHDTKGNPDGYIGKETFFYVACGVVIAFNFLLNLLKTQIQKIDFEKLNPASIWAKNAEELNALLETWFNAFIALVNTFIIFALMALKRVNAADGQKLDMNYNWLLIAGLAILMILIFYLPIKLLYTNPEKED
jgi:ABC-type transport system involved in cytochrome bd biosynthesis fused ATPase/permease subunit